MIGLTDPTRNRALTHVFPDAETLAAADPDALPMPRSRGRALVRLALAVAQGEVVLDRGADRADIRSALLALPGIGPWTADYISMRALGDPDVFLGTDLGARQGLAQLGIDPDDAAARDRVLAAMAFLRPHARVVCPVRRDRRPTFT